MFNSLRNKWLILIVLAITWGTSFILIKKGVEVFSPYQVGAYRVGLAGLALSVIGVPALRKMDKKTLFWASCAGAFGNFIPMFLFPIAEVHVSSSVAGILNSLVPIFVLIIGYFLFKTQNSKQQILGAVLGFLGAGLLVLTGDSTQSNTQMGYALLVVLATICYAVSSLIVKEHLGHVKSLELSGAVFTIWAIPSFLILLFSGIVTDFSGTQEQWEAVGYITILSVVGTAIAGILFYGLIQRTSAVFATSVTYLMPIVAVAWGVIAGENISGLMLVGALLILIGVYLIRER